MKLALIQMNSTVGDFNGNLQRFINLAKDISKDNILVGAELTFSGYQINDMISRLDFMDEQDLVINNLQQWLKKEGRKAIVGRVGYNTRNYGKDFENQAVFLDGISEKVIAVKRLLPTYDVFDENRYFEAGEKSEPFIFESNNIGVIICEDGWNENHKPLYKNHPVNDLISDGVDFILSINASPTSLDKNKIRINNFDNISKRSGIPFVSVNQVGANDTIIFDGGSFVCFGDETIQAPLFEEGVLLVDTFEKQTVWIGGVNNIQSACYDSNDNEWVHYVHSMLVLGIKDYFRKNGIKQASLALSGGADSSLVLALAVDALGSENITAVTMPSKISSEGSVSDSQELADMLGVKLYHRAIKDDFDTAYKIFEASFGEQPNRLTMENLQARIRGTSIMAWSNQNNTMVLSTGNKSEVAVGYCTLYGDTNGGLNPIGDLYKTEVYKLLKFYAEQGRMPWSVIEKAPSAELFPGQKDEDSLPPYPVLDAFLQLYLEYKNLNEDEITKRRTLLKESGFGIERGMEIIKKVEGAEFKRKQSCPIIRVRSNTFGIGRNIPVARRSFVTENTVKKLLGD